MLYYWMRTKEKILPDVDYHSTFHIHGDISGSDVQFVPVSVFLELRSCTFPLQKTVIRLVANNTSLVTHVLDHFEECVLANRYSTEPRSRWTIFLQGSNVEIIFLKCVLW